MSVAGVVFSEPMLVIGKNVVWVKVRL